MRPLDRRPRSRRVLRPEPLEDRSLLSAVVPAHPAAEVAHHAHAHVHVHPHVHHQPAPHPHAARVNPVVHVVTIRANGLLNQTPGLPGADVVGTAFGSGTGHQYGQVVYTSNWVAHIEDIFSGAATINAGAATMTSPKLGEVDVAYSGTESLMPNGLGSEKLTGFVTNSTGRFPGYGGTFTADGVLNPSLGQFSLYITLRLTRPIPSTATTPVATTPVVTTPVLTNTAV